MFNFAKRTIMGQFFERVFKNWQTTLGAIVIIVCVSALIYFEKIQVDEITGIVTMILGGGAAIGLTASKDKRDSK